MKMKKLNKMEMLSRLIHHRDILLASIRDREWKSGDLNRMISGDINYEDFLSVRSCMALVLIEINKS